MNDLWFIAGICEVEFAFDDLIKRKKDSLASLRFLTFDNMGDLEFQLNGVDRAVCARQSGDIWA